MSACHVSRAKKCTLDPQQSTYYRLSSYASLSISHSPSSQLIAVRRVPLLTLASAELPVAIRIRRRVYLFITMGDGETVISQTSAIEDYPSASYSATDDGDRIGNATETTVIEDQLVDGSALSPEEDRLWNMVRSNSLDFNAWTALIDETEKTSDDKVLKIRKVYDAFLAEFPLCYGYWKKYADHEARLGSIDKVVEVYEHGVQGVTYSVDMWLHYCVFAISTYEDPDTIRRYN
ncbi:hypothetical protein LXL04_018717 [Taraxacum kok-saghyz]